MSSILEAITEELGADTLASLGSAVGADSAQTRSMLSAALPALVGGLARQSASAQGAQSLAGALERDHTPNLMDQLGPMAAQMLGGSSGGGSSSGGLLGGLSSLAGGLLGGGGASGGANSAGLGALLPAALQMMEGGQASGLPKALNGAGILGHLFGQQRDGVAANAAQASGVEPSVMMKFLSLLAPVVMSALGTLKARGGLDASGLAGLLQQERQQIGAAASQPDGADSDGLGVDDLLRAGGALAQSGILGKLFR